MAIRALFLAFGLFSFTLVFGGVLGEYGPLQVIDNVAADDDGCKPICDLDICAVACGEDCKPYCEAEECKPMCLLTQVWERVDGACKPHC